MPNIRRQPLLTSVVGSYPTDELPARRAIERAVEDQLLAGVDVISDGQPRGARQWSDRAIAHGVSGGTRRIPCRSTKMARSGHPPSTCDDAHPCRSGDG